VVAKSYMTNVLRYMGKYLRISSYIRKPFLIHIWLCNCSTLNFLIYEENLFSFFISVDIHFIGILLFSITQCLSRNFVSWSRRGEGTREGGRGSMRGHLLLFQYSVMKDDRGERRHTVAQEYKAWSKDSFVKMMSKNSILGVKIGITES
jgi:hypothetical protein